MFSPILSLILPPVGVYTVSSPQLINIFSKSCRHGLEARNSQVATNVSGTSIGLIMSHFTQPVRVEVLEEDVVFSDHQMVLGKVPLAVQFSFQNTIGRIFWAHGDAWDTVFALWTPCLETCTLAFQQATSFVNEAKESCA